MSRFGRIHNLANIRSALIGQCPDQRSNKKNSREIPRGGWPYLLENVNWKIQKHPPEYEDNPIYITKANQTIRCL